MRKREESYDGIYGTKGENGIREESLGLEKQEKLVKYFGVKLRQWVGLWSSIIVSYIGRSLSPKQHATHAKKKKNSTHFLTTTKKGAET